MKEYISIFAMVAIASLASSCQKEISDKIETGTPDSELMDIVLSVSSESQNTKTQIDGKTLVWEETDELCVFDKNGTQQIFSIVPGSIDGGSASFAGSVAAGTETLYAVYPYSSAVGLSEGELSATVPAVQTIGEGLNVAHGAMTTVATGTVGADLAFKNVFSLLKVQVTETDIVAINVCGTAIAGTAVINPQTGSLERLSAAEHSVTVTYKDGQTAFPAGYYYIAVLPGVHAANDFSIVLSRKDSDRGLFKESTKEFTLARNGGLNFGALDTKAEDVFIIKDKATLKTFLATTNKYNDTDKAIVTADIDCEGESIPAARGFLGTLDGRNHRIYNIKRIGNSDWMGFLTSVGDGSNSHPSVLKNICVGSSDYNFATKTGTYDGVSVIETSYTGGLAYVGLVGYCGIGATIENAVNFAAVTVSDQLTADKRWQAGGIAGTMKNDATITNCYNFGTVTVNAKSTSGDSHMGGIAGWIDGTNCTIDGCENHGAVTSNCGWNYVMGGILGIVKADKTGAKIQNCKNTGAVTLKAASITGRQHFIGGIVGANVGSASITGCENTGTLTADGTTTDQQLVIGGILGGTYTAASGTFENNVNRGAIINKTAVTGGDLRISGVLGSTTQPITINNCRHYGSISINDIAGGLKTTYAGGVLGYTSGATVLVTECENHGSVNTSNTNINGELYLGGVAAFAQLAKQMKVENCLSAADASFDINLSQVSGGLRFGGVFGGTAKDSNTNYAKIDINGCKNYTDITIVGSQLAQSFIGGVMGATRQYTRSYDNQTAKVYKGNENHGELDVTITAPAATSNYYVGGVSANDNGEGSGSFEDCMNTADIRVTTAIKGFIGGIAAKTFPGTHKNLVNSGNITVVNKYNASGAAGNSVNCGGIFGYTEGANRLENCSVRANITTSDPEHLNTWMFVGGFFGRPNGNLTMADCSFGGAIDANQYNSSDVKNVSGPFIGAFNDNTARTVTFEGAGNKIIAGTTVSGGTHPTYTSGETVSDYTWIAGTYNAKTLVGTVSVVVE